MLSVLIVYLILNLVIGIYVGKVQSSRDIKDGKDFINSYFIGGRSMGGLVLAMTLVATFTSASSFIGGPGIAAGKGLVWVYLSMIQVPTAFIILGILGKKFAVFARETGAVTVTDYLRIRYKSPVVVWISSVCLVIFFIAQMMSQFIGGAVLFQTVTGLPYIYGLAFFGLVVIIYTSVGGFKAVVTTDTIQGIIMVIGSFLILFTIVRTAGGFDSLVAKMNDVKPGWDDITAGGSVKKPFVMSFWVLVGIGVLGLPQTAVRGMGFKDTKALHRAIVYGTIVVGLLMLLMHISGAFAPAIIDMKTVKSTDYVIPSIVLKYMNPVVAGLFIAAPLAAVMSTVSSLLILSSAAIVKDLYMNYFMREEKKNLPDFERSIGRKSLVTTFIIGAIVFIFTIYPPDLIVWINLFALGGLECAFFCPIVFGLYWKRGNKTGAVASSICGVLSFIVISNMQWDFFGMTPIVPAMLISIVTFILGSLIGMKTEL